MLKAETTYRKSYNQTTRYNMKNQQSYKLVVDMEEISLPYRGQATFIWLT